MEERSLMERAVKKSVEGLNYVEQQKRLMLSSSTIKKWKR